MSGTAREAHSSAVNGRVFVLATVDALPNSEQGIDRYEKALLRTPFFPTGDTSQWDQYN